MRRSQPRETAEAGNFFGSDVVKKTTKRVISRQTWLPRVVSILDRSSGTHSRPPSAEVDLKFRVSGARAAGQGAPPRGGPFYRGQTQNALFIARSGWQFIEFPLKAKELRSRVGTRAARGAFVEKRAAEGWS